MLSINNLEVVGLGLDHRNIQCGLITSYLSLFSCRNGKQTRNYVHVLCYVYGWLFVYDTVQTGFIICEALSQYGILFHFHSI